MNTPITVVFFGKSGSGKGTQSTLLIKKLGADGEKAVYVETGQRFRDFVKRSDSYIARKTYEVMNAGKFMPPFMPIWNWTGMLIDELRTGREHLVFDGLCRQPEEAPILDSALKFLDRGKPVVILLDATHEEVTNRLLKRGRHDDQPEKIAERLRSFEAQAMPSVNYFKQSPNVTFVTIDGNQTIEKVHEDILVALGLAKRG